MLAQCTACQGIFTIGRFGLHACPTCGTQTLVEDPATPSPYQPPVAMVDVDASAPRRGGGDLLPWERRREIGYWTGFKDTVAAILFRPGETFDRMVPDTADGALSYYALVAVVPHLLRVVIGWARFDPDSFDKAMRALPHGIPEEFTSLLSSFASFYATPLGLAASLGASAVWQVLGLAMWAGCTHLFVRAFARGGTGWTATWKTLVYALTPALIHVLPVCGSFIASLWILVLAAIGLARIHGTTLLVSVASMLLGLLLPLFLIASGLGVILSLLGSQG